MTATATNLFESNVRIFLEVQNAYKECAPEVREVITEMTELFLDKESSAQEKQLAINTIVEAIFPSASVDVLEAEREMSTSPEARAFEKQMDSDEEEFASRVHFLMKKQGLTQAQLAEKVGVSQPAISNILSRKCRPQDRTVRNIAEALGVTPAELWPPLSR